MDFNLFLKNLLNTGSRFVSVRDNFRDYYNSDPGDKPYYITIGYIYGGPTSYSLSFIAQRKGDLTEYTLDDLQITTDIPGQKSIFIVVKITDDTSKWIRYLTEFQREIVRRTVFPSHADIELKLKEKPISIERLPSSILPADISPYILLGNRWDKSTYQVE